MDGQPRGFFGRRGAFRSVSWCAQKRAANAVQTALRRGVLTRPDACSRCGAVMRGAGAQGLVQAHHADYAKPLDVVWLCPRCHCEEHRRLNAATDDGLTIERHRRERAAKHARLAALRAPHEAHTKAQREQQTSEPDAAE